MKKKATTDRGSKLQRRLTKCTRSVLERNEKCQTFQLAWHRLAGGTHQRVASQGPDAENIYVDANNIDSAKVKYLPHGRRTKLLSLPITCTICPRHAIISFSHRCPINSNSSLSFFFPGRPGASSASPSSIISASSSSSSSSSSSPALSSALLPSTVSSPSSESSS